MNRIATALGLVVLFGSMLSAAAVGAELLSKKTESGTIVGYKDTPLMPWTGAKYHVHDPDRPVPKQVTVGPPEARPAPSDALALFDGKGLSNFKPSSWKTSADTVEAGHGSLETKAPFGDCQLHLQWAAPAESTGHMMSRGNSGVIFMGLYEIQIFDSHASHAQQIYPDGQAASIYGQTPPLVNACRGPGQWQSFDIVFTAPVFEGDKLVKRATVTMLHNGVLVHLNQEIMGPMAHRQIVPYAVHPARLPLVLQGHGSPVRFRNIWIRPLGDMP